VPHPWLISLLILSSGCASANFTIHPDRAIGPAIVGFGAQMNPYLYCRPNQGQAIDETSIHDLEHKIIQLSPQTVRIFVLKQWFDGRSDPISKGDPRTADSFFRVVELAQRAGATVNLTYWYEPGWTDPPGQMKWFAELVREMIEQRHLSAVRYLTVQNEPNLHEDKISKTLYARLYLELNRALRRAGVRDRVGIVSGDLVQDNQQSWFEMLGSKLAPVSEAYSTHVYWNYWDTPKILRRLDGPREIVDQLPRDQQRPLFVTEFGVRGRNQNGQTNDPGDAADGSPIATKPLQAMELAQFILDGLNRGYAAFVVWTMSDALYDHPMQYGLIGSARDGWPLKPGYHMLRLLTHTISPGWHAVEVSGSVDGIVVSAARGPQGELTILALNTTDQPRKITIDGIGKSFTSSFIWNQHADGLISRLTQPPPGSRARLEMEIPPQGLLVGTTLRIDLSMPGF
jgi:hypothetical protein